MRRFVPALFHWRRMHFDPGIKVLSQIVAGFRCPLMRCGDSARQNVADYPGPCGPARGPAPSTMAFRLLGSFSGLIRSRPVERALTSFRHVLRRSPARRRSSGSVRQPAVANPGRTISQPHRSVRAPLKVSSCTVLTPVAQQWKQFAIIRNVFSTVGDCDFENSCDAEQRRKASNNNKTTSFQLKPWADGEPEKSRRLREGLTMSDRTMSRVASISRFAFND